MNFAIKPRRPVATAGGTVSSGTITSLVVWDTRLRFSGTCHRQIPRCRIVPGGVVGGCSELSYVAVQRVKLMMRAGRPAVLPLKQIFKVRIPIEWREIVKLFAGANEPRWNSEFILDCHHDAAFAAAIQFGHDQAS